MYERTVMMIGRLFCEESMDGATRGWSIKYYKGLGTSTAKEAKEYFAALDHHRKTFAWTTDGDGSLIDMAFSKKRVEDRKKWLLDYEPGTYLDMSGDEVRYDEFINKAGARVPLPTRPTHALIQTRRLDSTHCLERRPHHHHRRVSD